MRRFEATTSPGRNRKFMTDHNESAGQSVAKGPGLEEARLRQQAIGVKLRHLFDDVVNEPVPDEFLDILRRADERAPRSDKA